LDKNFLITIVVNAIDQSKGDWGRNQYLLKIIKENKEISNSDKLYLERISGLEIPEITYKIDNQYQQILKNDILVSLNPNLEKCVTCNNEIKLNERSLRYRNFWYHERCYRIISDNQHKREKTKIKKHRIKTKKDPVQFILVGAIFVFLIGSVYFL